ncbi:ABC transporter ATP-binding protein [Aquaspirillum sp. LM1]|uniref:ABC transporter ATP-binding protein n=1 Tax=Aquaspirillum sp. LM1 TaxID=1938604 RepID=UPI000984021B|nr:ABC transporter ATP-binding protein [Aquaspirillum sp. LM1]AQR66507.1 ABC transporter ATP-binding protein [Aquaspirillum sp. LM1]
MPSDRVAVRCQALTKVYGEGENAVHALRGIDLEIAYGELMMLVGPSGCGKTTLISVLAGILDRSTGHCQVLGEDLDRLSGNARTRWRGEHIGFVFQGFNLIPALTATENVAVPLLIRRIPRPQALAAAAAMLEQVGLGNRRDTLPAQLSGGQQQRVAIARALIHQPRLLVCDEPTSALDHDTGQQIMQLLRKMATGPERALIVVTHDARIFPFADRMAQMDDGQVVSVTRPPAVEIAQ